MSPGQQEDEDAEFFPEPRFLAPQLSNFDTEETEKCQ
jgi:hypothetical protein